MPSIPLARWIGQPDELFDLANDPEELTNQYNDAKHRDVRDRLQTRLTEWMREVDDPELAK